MRFMFHSYAGGVFARVPIVEGMVSQLFDPFLIFCSIKLYYDVSQLRLGVLTVRMCYFYFSFFTNKFWMGDGFCFYLKKKKFF